MTIRTLLCVFVVVGAQAGARTDLEDVPVMWQELPGAPTIQTGVTSRTMTGDELWDGNIAACQILQTGDATRTVMLAPIGDGGFPLGAELTARVTTWPGKRILFRKSDGELIAFWGGEASQLSQWVSFQATDTGWETRVSTPGLYLHTDEAFSIRGAYLTMNQDGFATDASHGGGEYGVRFETDSPRLFVNVHGNPVLFRVLADEVVIATVSLNPNNASGPILIPIDLGKSRARQVEILADSLEFGGIEVPDVRYPIVASSIDVLPVRMLWITDHPAESGTIAYPWIAARQAGYDLWFRSWPPGGDAGDAVLLETTQREIAAINPDIIVIACHEFVEPLDPREFSDAIAARLGALETVLRPETVKLALPPLYHNGADDRTRDRAADLIARQAKRHDFHFVNWQKWVDGRPDDPTSGDAHLVLTADGAETTDRGNEYIGYRFAEEILRSRIEKRAEIASLKRLQSSRSTSLASADSRR